MKRTLSVLILFLFTLISPLHAENSRADYRTVEKLLDVMAMEENYLHASRKLIAIYLEQTPHMKPYKRTIEKFFYRHMHYAQVKADIVQSYQRRFSSAEIKDLIVFYSTPVGKKMTRSIAEVMVRVTDAGMKHMKSNLKELEEMIASDAERLIRSKPKKPIQSDGLPEIDPFQ